MTDMEKVETDNIAVVQARALKKYCDDRPGCDDDDDGCVFAGYGDDGHFFCKIGWKNIHEPLTPCDWDV